ncbi:MAG TPA: hypothetical protein VJX66_06790 [Amycolatopsis sp.]|nr:hypothetical protein [Amycolatopsis sp.]
MRASELLGRPVRDADGRILGAIREIRAEPVMRDGVVEIAVRGVIVGRTRVRLFGYQRHDQRGPSPLVALIRWLHRRSRYVAWEDLEVGDDVEIRVTKRFQDLAGIETPSS